MLHTLKAFIKKDLVFSIATTIAILTMFLGPPNKAYFDYIDFSVIAILFCLMCVVAGFNQCGLLNALSFFLLSKTHNLRSVSILFIILCFFSSMFLTNDVALIAFIPLTLLTLHTISSMQVIYLIVLETIAANLGSMLTPIGNPQNLYLYSYFNLDIIEFIKIVSPICILSFIILMLLACFIKK